MRFTSLDQMVKDICEIGGADYKHSRYGTVLKICVNTLRDLSLHGAIPNYKTVELEVERNLTAFMPKDVLRPIKIGKCVDGRISELRYASDIYVPKTSANTCQCEKEVKVYETVEIGEDGEKDKGCDYTIDLLGDTCLGYAKENIVLNGSDEFWVEYAENGWIDETNNIDNGGWFKSICDNDIAINWKIENSGGLVDSGDDFIETFIPEYTRLEVLINGNWEDVTSEIKDNKWERLSTLDEITDYKLYEYCENDLFCDYKKELYVAPNHTYYKDTTIVDISDTEEFLYSLNLEYPSSEQMDSYYAYGAVMIIGDTSVVLNKFNQQEIDLINNGGTVNFTLNKSIILQALKDTYKNDFWIDGFNAQNPYSFVKVSINELDQIVIERLLEAPLDNPYNKNIMFSSLVNKYNRSGVPGLNIVGMSGQMEDMFTINLTDNLQPIYPPYSAQNNMGYYIQIMHLPINYRFDVKIDDTWHDETSNIVNGVWELLSTKLDVTEWKIIDLDDSSIFSEGTFVGFNCSETGVES